jgi:D-alanyl-D-alanine carboxypeptidase
MKKRKKKQRRLLFVSLFIFLIGLGGIFFFWFYPKEEVAIIFQEKLDFEVNSELSISSLIKDSATLEILEKDEKVDTSKVGRKEITIRYKDKNKEKSQVCTIQIIDETAPVITYTKELSTKVGSSIDLLKDVTVLDNSKEEIAVTVEGNYDINTEGTYSLEYVAKDSSGNEAREGFTLIVSKVKVNTYHYPKIVPPNGEKELIGTSKKGYSIYKINGSVYIDDVLIANKTYALASGFVPSDTYKSAVGITSQCATCINNTAYNAWKSMKSDATALGLNIWIQSGYRPESVQVKLYNNYVARDGKAAADTYSSRPGHSEHQTGLCFDLNSITDAFANTPEGKWVNENAYRYGFVIRFPKGKENETGYKYESWHLRYVGTDLSYKLYNQGDWISLEDYFGITSEYQD